MTQALTSAVKSAPNWGYCPVCLKERQLLPGRRKLTVHRMWVNDSTTGLYGEMRHCKGSGIEPMADWEMELENITPRP